MYQTQELFNAQLLEPCSKQAETPKVDEITPHREELLDMALDLLEAGRALEADRLLTAAIYESPDDERLWLAAGMCRLRRGAVRAAASAFEMGAWLGDDQVAREFLSLLEGIVQ